MSGLVQLAGPAILVVPAMAAAVLAVVPGYRQGAAINVAATLLTFSRRWCCSIARPAAGTFLLVDDLNLFLIVLNTFVGFTTSAYSAGYIAYELAAGKLTPGYLRFYHAMYQIADVRHEPGASRRQHRPDVGGDRAGDADHCADGRHLPDARRRWKRPGNTSSSAASASRWRCSAASSSISPPVR